ncbi:hypothetical protein EVAR_4055_1 [Eumeta japonica]|uniref:Uncharacterized protein n=1 Tax=Eumeta variegata TaxID=151549 RepID=A0A4C1T6X3_EUMVA|nr:hypothetical protein EVAR_4055_1 [Eumeta japonica]
MFIIAVEPDNTCRRVKTYDLSCVTEQSRSFEPMTEFYKQLIALPYHSCVTTYRMVIISTLKRLQLTQFLMKPTQNVGKRKRRQIRKKPCVWAERTFCHVTNAAMAIAGDSADVKLSPDAP